MPRHPNSDKGRAPLQFTSRPCKDCKEICPFEQFCAPSTRAARGFVLRARCKPCDRKYQRQWKAARRQIEEKRLADNEKRRGYPQKKNGAYISLWQWVKYRMKRWEDLGAYPCVVFLIPTNAHTPHAKPELCRRWVGLTWTFREDKVGITPPARGIPFIRLSRRVALKHPTCPDGWDVAVRIVQNRLRLMFPPEEGE